MNLRSLRYFAAISQAKSITKAAEKLHIAQPAVSRQIQNLEEEIGVRLMNRSRAGIKLTGAGEFLLQRVLPLLVELDQAKETLSQQANAEVQDLVIGLTTGEGLTVASTLISGWNQQFPAAKIRIFEGLAPTIYAGLKDGSIDIGVVPEPLPYTDIWTKPLFEEPIVFIAPKEDVDSGMPFRSLDNLDVPSALSLPIILPSSPNPLRTSIGEIADIYHVTLNVALELDSMSIIKDLVRRGNAYAFTTYAHLTNELEHDLLRVVEMPKQVFKRNISLFGLLQNDHLAPDSPAVAFIEELILNTVKDGRWPGAKLL
ncbi:transcriptional regulator, LysR family [Roseovarius lutimaris]|uniref:Transcriptional regulator, LysR family n=1 Tax=Roseovarius lutimaris TaxID=1005928 RepID=A0A1I5EHL0_9RHOB|nr:LysR family transcriptional regulator [Roseovarius lutimaris]SFO10890.1 transcriptional regulator, LysR family [Roseovarius lutimaris]